MFPALFADRQAVPFPNKCIEGRFEWNVFARIFMTQSKSNTKTASYTVSKQVHAYHTSVSFSLIPLTISFYVYKTFELSDCLYRPFLLDAHLLFMNYKLLGGNHRNVLMINAVSLSFKKFEKCKWKVKYQISRRNFMIWILKASGNCFAFLSTNSFYLNQFGKYT